jgi:fatty acid desaturase
MAAGAFASTPRDSDASNSDVDVNYENNPLELSYSTLRKRFADALRPRRSIYWPDLLACVGVGWASFAAAIALQSNLAASVALTAVSVLALYRAALFIHELAHLKRGAVSGLETAWNISVGVPLLIPSLMYIGSHGDHHRRAVYGTEDDPEYEPIAYWRPYRVFLSMFTYLGVPAALVLRWGVVGPVSYLYPPLRRLVVERASALVINTHYRRKPPKGPALMRWALQEAACALWIWSLAYGAWTGAVPISWLVHGYLLAVGILTVNHVRTLASHRYVRRGGQVSREGQLLDSVNILNESIATKLLAPVGQRYHALHHVLPGLPYHSLGSVHRAFVAELPPDSPYHATAVRSVTEGLLDLLRTTRLNSRPGQPGGGPGRTERGRPASEGGTPSADTTVKAA